MLGILVWQEGGEYVGLLIAIGAVALALLAWWLVRRKREGKPTLLDPGLFKFPHFTTGISGQLLQNVTLGGAMIALPIFLQMTLEYNAMKTGLDPGAALAQHVRRRAARGTQGGEAAPEQHHPGRIRAQHRRARRDHPDRAAHRLGPGPLHPAADHGLGARPARLAAEQLHPVADRGGAGERGGRSQLRRRLVRALVRPGDGRRHHARLPRLRVHQPRRRQRRDPAGAAAADQPTRWRTTPR